ncbi:unnamed protein product, partial [Cylicostephanus goldi]
LEDDRFKKLFSDEDFEVNEENEQFKRNAAFAHHKEKSTRVVEEEEEDEEHNESEEEEEVAQSELPDLNEAEGSHIGAEASSSDSGSEEDEESLSTKKKLAKEKERQKQEKRERHRKQYEELLQQREAERTARLVNKPKKFVFYELDSTENTRKFLDEHVKEDNDSEEFSSLAAKKSSLQEKGEFEKHEDVFGGRSMTFTLAKKGASGREAKAAEERKKHAKERKATVRKPTLNIKRSLKKLPGNLSKP